MSPADSITTSVAHTDGIAVVTVTGEIDLSTATALEAAIAEALAAEPAVLVVELSAVDFMASSGLRVLVATQQKVSKSAQLAVVADKPATRRPIEVTDLDKVFALYSTLDEALAAVSTTAD